MSAAPNDRDRAVPPAETGWAAPGRAAPRRRSQRAWRTVAPVWAERGADDVLSPAQVEALRPLDRHADRNTDAEYAFYRLHGRFQRYAEEELFAEERILAWVPWTASADEGWRARLGRRLALGGREATAGAFVVTDRQILLMRDDADPSGGSLFWGYTAHATTPERLATVAVTDAPNRRLILTLGLQAGTNEECVRWVFPATVAADLRRAAARLEAFLPRSGDWRLRRPGSIRPPRRLFVPPSAPSPRSRRPRSPAEADDAAARQALAPILEHLLRSHPAPDGQPRRVHASVFVPAATAQTGDRLLAVTQEHLFIVPAPDRGEPAVHPLGAITSVELRRSVLGPHLAWSAGSASGGRTIIPFPAAALDRCRTLFATLRQALTLLPVEAAGPDIPGMEPEPERPTGAKS